MSDPQQLLRRWSIAQCDASDPTSDWTATCLCGWGTSWPTYVEARRSCMYHYYVCPKRFELPDGVDEHV